MMNQSPTGDKTLLTEGFPQTSQSNVNIDDDVSDLLRDNFGPANIEDFAPKLDFSDIELDKNLSDILEDLQKVVKSEDGENNISFDSSSLLDDDPIRSLLNLQNEIEMEIEEERVEKLRNPRFQTLPAYQKRAKQETQWINALNSASVGDKAKPVTGQDGVVETVRLSRQPRVTTRLSSSTDVEVISISEDEIVDVTPKVPSQLPLTKIKSNFLMNTEKHLSSANHFPANSRIFNRSLEELQSTAKAISQTYQAEEGRRAKRGRERVPARITDSKRIRTDKMRSILRKNNNHLKISQSKEDVYNTVWVPALRETNQRVHLSLKQTANHALPPMLPTTAPINPPTKNMAAMKPNLVPNAKVPVQVVPKQVKLPINGQQQGGACLLLNMTSSNPVVLNKSQILQSVTAKRSVAQPETVKKSCYNCERLASYLPFLGYTMRRTSQREREGQGLLRRSSAGDSLVLLCEICGTFVRESVIFREKMSLSHVSAAYFPKFFNNSFIEIRPDEETQNYIPI